MKLTLRLKSIKDKLNEQFGNNTKPKSTSTAKSEEDQTTFDLNTADELCEECSLLPLEEDSLYTWLETSIESFHTDLDHAWNGLGFWSQPGSKSCSLCNILQCTAKEYNLTADLLTLKAWLGMENIDGSLRLLLLLKLEDENSSANPGWLTVSSPLLCSFNDSIRPFKINKSQVNWSAVKSWLEECEQKHTNACNHDSTSHSPAGLRVIDCETRKIISAPEVCKYTALSYVWSQNKENDVAEKHSLFKPPRAIEAAITCTTIIGFRYLWIDRYCIDHEDIATKHTLIQGMDEVYRGAAVTLIFATGQGVESGVPGISYILRPQQLTTSVNGLDITLMPDTQGSVARSKWASRGWTYQEGLLSTRRLVFTDKQVYFQCLEAHAQEAIIPMRGASLADSFQIFPFLMRQDAPDIYTKINEYVPRDLTFDTDILNAFSGLLHQAWSSTHSFLGIPFWCVPVADPVLMDRSFIAALAWRPNTGLRQGVKHMTRRPGFPSWSWTGWRGMTGIKPRPAKCVFQSTSSDQVTNSFGSVQLEDTKGVKISVKDYVDRMNIHWDMSQFSLRLHLTAWYIEVLLRPLPGDEVWDNVLITSDGHNDFARGLVMATVPRDEAFFGIPGLLEKRWPMLYFQDYDGKDYVNWGLILKPTGGGCYEKLGVTTRFEVHPAEAKRRSFRKTDGCECEIGGVSELECELRTIVLI